jgi:transposase
MSAAEIIEELRRMPSDKRHELVAQIRDEFGEFDDEPTPELIAELDRRAERALAHPEQCRPLDDAIDDLEKRFRARR